MALIVLFVAHILRYNFKTGTRSALLASPPSLPSFLPSCVLCLVIFGREERKHEEAFDKSDKRKKSKENSIHRVLVWRSLVGGSGGSCLFTHARASGSFKSNSAFFRTTHLGGRGGLRRRRSRCVRNYDLLNGTREKGPAGLSTLAKRSLPAARPTSV